MKVLFMLIAVTLFTAWGNEVDIKNSRIEGDFTLPNTVAPLEFGDYLGLATHATGYIPVSDTPFEEHVRTACTTDEEEHYTGLFESQRDQLRKSKYMPMVGTPVTAIAPVGDRVWIGTAQGLFVFDTRSKNIVRHPSYGVSGPLSTVITDIVSDSKGNVWIGTPIGLSMVRTDGTWKSVRGSEGLPVEDIAALAVDSMDNLWIGTSEGAILYTPDAEGRQWYYRSGKRYLEDNDITGVAISADEKAIFFETGAGISKLQLVSRTLAEKAAIMETRLNEWHRRMGLVGACVFDHAENPTRSRIPDNDNDGLWTSYHVVAMSLAYAATGEDTYKESARKGMHALIMLQNASGVPGLVARSVVPISQRDEMNAQWRETPDGNMLWKSDTSSDEIDGHFFAFYAYWEHIAKHDTEESARIRKQVKEVIDYIVDNNYQLIDWDGERTRWGFWNPEALNSNPGHYLENGLNSAQILSFLKVSYYITGNEKYKNHYDYLITEHGYLGNVLLEKKVFPDMNNHSDNQLGFVALYPLLQLEHDPRARPALQQAVRRHYMTLSRDGSAFFYFAAATIDPDFVDIKAAVENLRQIHTDRRQWEMVNSNRKDIVWDPRKDRFDRQQLLTVLPADERNFDRWNRNPYYADGGKGGAYEDDGGSWLLAYWIGRYHGFIE